MRERHEYDIIDWQSCTSVDSRNNKSHPEESTQKNRDDYGLSRDENYSINDVVFPKLFNEDDSESEGSSIINLPEFGLSDIIQENPHTNLHEQTVYSKVSNWVLSQRRFFLNVETATNYADDDIEVIDPVDLFHETILEGYCLITENDNERRAIFRELTSNHYEVVSREEAMHCYDYKFLKEPGRYVEMELTPLITFHELHENYANNHRKTAKKKHTDSIDIEEVEQSLPFLSVSRLLENFIIFNREGNVVNGESDEDIWLEEKMKSNSRISENLEYLEFVSSWYSENYPQDTDENKTFITDKVTVISVTRSDDEVWLDAPEIPDWLDEQHDELELFNQPSRPLYYYRDRIKGCYRIIGVEDETVILFSGNDDDNIFYDHHTITENSGYNSTADQQNYTFHRTCNVDPKNDSGIEDDVATNDSSFAFRSCSKNENFDEKPVYIDNMRLLRYKLILVVFLTSLFISHLLSGNSNLYEFILNLFL